MARRPKSFQIDTVSVEALKPSGYLSAGQDTAVPSRFEATFTFTVPDVIVMIEVQVTRNLEPVVLEFAIRGKTTDPIKGILLRQVPVDFLLKRAMAEAIVPATQRHAWLATLPPGVQEQALNADDAEDAAPTGRQRIELQGDQDARTAARLLKEAKMSGVSAAVDQVARSMNRSRSQVQRYLRRARALKLLSEDD